MSLRESPVRTTLERWLTAGSRTQREVTEETEVQEIEGPTAIGLPLKYILLGKHFSLDRGCAPSVLQDFVDLLDNEHTAVERTCLRVQGLDKTVAEAQKELLQRLCNHLVSISEACGVVQQEIKA